MEIRAMQGDDRRFFNPDRDLAHNFPLIACAVAELINDGEWVTETRSLLEGFTDEQCDDSFLKLIDFVCNTSYTDRPANGYANIKTDLEKSGFSAVPEKLKLALLANLGMAVLRMYWDGARSTSFVGAPVPQMVKDIHTRVKELFEAAK